MSLTLYIAKRLHFDMNGERRMSRPAVRVATAGIAIGLAVMLLAVAIIVGFKSEVSNQVVGFGSHLQVANYGESSNYETSPLTATDSLMRALARVPNVYSVQRVATKPGVIKLNDDFEGIVLKGIDSTFDWRFFSKHLVAGEIDAYADSAVSNRVLISQKIANLLQLSVDDSFITYFFTDPIRARKFTIAGIYNTTFEEFDKLFIFTDIRQVQNLNQWRDNEISQIELLVNDFGQIDQARSDVFRVIANQYSVDGTFLQVRTIQELVPRIFEWLDMLDMNAWVILILMLAVAGFNMISGLLIIILERAQTIGILKAMGARNWTIRRIFLTQAVFLIGKGMLWGNVVGCVLIAIQHYTHLVPLDAAMYYVNYVPVQLSFAHWLVLNLGTLLLTLLMLILPSYIITRISPARSIRFE